MRPPLSTLCQADECLRIARVIPRLVFTPAQPGSGVARRSAVLLRLALCQECGDALAADPARFLTDHRMKALRDAHLATGRRLPERDEVSVELVPLDEWNRRPAVTADPQASGRFR